MTSVQLVVVGGGPGGYAAAFLAADLGLTTALVDPEVNPGGVCVYRGCIPSKALLHVADLLDESRHAKAWGIEFGEPKIDLNKLRDFKNAVVKRLTSGTGQLVKHRKIQYIQGFAEIANPHTLRIKKVDGTEDTLTFEHAILATGSLPAMPPMLKVDDPRVMDSTGALDLPDVPKTLLVVGGGYIGLELGTVYAALGSKVTVVEMTDGLLPGADRDLVNILAKRIGQITEAVWLNTKVTKITKGTKETKELTVTFEGEGFSGDKAFERVLVSIGRRPNASVPGLDKLRIKLDKRGFIEVNESRETAEPGIYAIGD